MAKAKPSMKGLFEKTAPAAGTPAAQDIIKARGVGLKESEWAELQKVADELGTNLHAVTAYGVRYFLKAYKAGKIKPETKETQALPEL